MDAEQQGMRNQQDQGVLQHPDCLPVIGFGMSVYILEAFCFCVYEYGI